jgi:hypothetical protein
MFNKLLLPFLLFLIQLSVFAQNSTAKSDTTKRVLKAGIYKTYEEFINNSPSITKEFVLIDDNYIDEEYNDTFLLGKTYVFKDGSEKEKLLWGVSDGKDVYILLSTDVFRRHTLTKLEYVGRYAFFQPKLQQV